MHEPVESLQQDLEGALVGDGQLAQHDGAARGALLTRLDEVGQQPATRSIALQPRAEQQLMMQQYRTPLTRKTGHFYFSDKL